MKRHIFFDLDHTIWDFDRNAHETLTELYETYELSAKGLTCAQTFIDTYTEYNHQLWADYHMGRISREHLREERFKKTFLSLGMDPALVPEAFEADYVSISPTKKRLFEDADAVLSYLQEKYTLHIISNGFKTNTLAKMEGCNLNRYFSNVIISEDVGCNKPDPRIFEYALDLAKATKEESVMIGDSLEADVYGAQQFGVDAIFFNPLKKEKPADVPREIHSLAELKEMF